MRFLPPERIPLGSGSQSRDGGFLHGVRNVSPRSGMATRDIFPARCFLPDHKGRQAFAGSVDDVQRLSPAGFKLFFVRMHLLPSSRKIFDREQS
jgi:hypothetical protein